MAYKVVWFDDKFSKPIFLYIGKNAVYRFIEVILKEYDYCGGVRKKSFYKNLVLYWEDNQRFQSSDKCWECDELFDAEDDSVRDHCHLTGACRGSVHWSCYVNLKLTENVLVIFHVLSSYDSHLMMQ